MRLTDNMETVVLFFVFAAGHLLLWLGVFGYQCFHWLKFGHWIPLTIADGLGWAGLHVQSSGWLGLDEIIWWFVDLPLSAIPLVAGLGFLACSFSAFSEEQKRRELVKRGLGGPHYRG
jgi:hypothetical protein